jgi:(2Fe-2S) ferredoxin
MGEDSSAQNREPLIRLIRRIAREEAEQILDEHLEDCEHQGKPIEEKGFQE